MSDLFRIVYCSRNPLGHSGASLEQILAVSRRNNAQDAITGALLALDGSFAQVLEGEFEAVQRTFERIQTDERHDEIILLQAHIASARLFGGWTMGLASPTDPAAAREILSAAIGQSGGESAKKLVELLDLLVRREEWAAAPA